MATNARFVVGVNCVKFLCVVGGEIERVHTHARTHARTSERDRDHKDKFKCSVVVVMSSSSSSLSSSRKKGVVKKCGKNKDRGVEKKEMCINDGGDGDDWGDALEIDDENNGSDGCVGGGVGVEPAGSNVGDGSQRESGHRVWATLKSMYFYPVLSEKAIKVFLKLKIPEKSSKVWQEKKEPGGLGQKSNCFPLRACEDHGFFVGE